MKKILIQRLLVISASLMLNLHVPAQTSHSVPFVIADAATHSTLLAGIKAKNEKTFNHLTRTFPEAILTNVRDEKDGMYIKATVNGNILRVKYDSKGKFANSVLSYPASILKDRIAEQVEMAFPGYIVFGQVLDVKSGDKSALLVMIENKKSWKRIRLTDEGMDVYEEYTKSL